jgi:putative protease
MKREDVEIMAPVGSYESLMAAIQAGADSVYFGIGQLNMRSKSTNNFTADDLASISTICQENKVKTYLTVNTVVYDKDIEEMQLVIDAAKKNNITAIIASDMAAINYAKQIGIEIHISTQVNISNYEAVKYYSQFADVMVMARELNLDQVSYIVKKIEENQLKGPSGKLIKVEMFVHGALCMAISGKCYLSLHEQNYSANRGTCLQTCRKAYTVTEKESGNQLEIDNEYIMSPKDLKTIHFINKILDAGVSVLKIEGRARSPEYVKTVISCYREAIDFYFDGTFSDEKIAIWDKQLKTVFNREFWDGYYLGQKLGEWSSKYGSTATKRKIYIGKVTNYFSKMGVAEILIEAGVLKLNDKVLIIGSTTGVEDLIVKELRVDLISVERAIQGEVCSIPINCLVRRSDKLYKLVDSNEIKQQ